MLFSNLWSRKAALFFTAITLAATTMLMVSLSPNTVAAKSKTLITGGGQGTFADGDLDPWDKGNPVVDGDLDGDQDVDGSYFAIAVEDDAGTPQGHFVCAMWGNTNILGLPLMAVEGRISRITIEPNKKSASITGIGTVDLGTGPQGFFRNVPFSVVLTPGGPGVGTLKLTVIGAFDGVPGDTVVGNGNYDLPVERVLSGHIIIE